ncbi:MAG: preprotein translocase subunit SecG [Micropepsaceae bacterium]
MEVVLLVVHLFITLAMTGVILLQRSEGGGLGIGGSSTPGGGLFSARGAANVLTRTTALLAAAFFVTSIALTLLAHGGNRGSSIIDRSAPDSVPVNTPDPMDPGSLLPSVPSPTGGEGATQPAATPEATPPAGEAPAESTPAPATPTP